MKIFRPALLLLPLFVLGSCGGGQNLTYGKPDPSLTRVDHDLLEDDRSLPSAMKDEADTLQLSQLQTYVDDWMGTPHRMGGMTKKGVDCSGFVICVYRDVYQDPFIHRRSSDLLLETERIDRTQLKEGDLVFFQIESRQVNHVGVYLGGGYFAHASLSNGLIVSHLSEDYYTKYFYCGGRKK